jgi:hypothetical protein
MNENDNNEKFLRQVCHDQYILQVCSQDDSILHHLPKEYDHL